MRGHWISYAASTVVLTLMAGTAAALAGAVCTVHYSSDTQNSEIRALIKDTNSSSVRQCRLQDGEMTFSVTSIASLGRPGVCKYVMRSVFRHKRQGGQT